MDYTENDQFWKFWKMDELTNYMFKILSFNLSELN
jgi:hypothetical protein